MNEIKVRGEKSWFITDDKEKSVAIRKVQSECCFWCNGALEKDDIKVYNILLHIDKSYLMLGKNRDKSVMVCNLCRNATEIAVTLDYPAMITFLVNKDNPLRYRGKDLAEKLKLEPAVISRIKKGKFKTVSQKNAESIHKCLVDSYKLLIERRTSSLDGLIKYFEDKHGYEPRLMELNYIKELRNENKVSFCSCDLMLRRDKEQPSVAIFIVNTLPQLRVKSEKESSELSDKFLNDDFEQGYIEKIISLNVQYAVFYQEKFEKYDKSQLSVFYVEEGEKPQKIKVEDSPLGKLQTRQGEIPDTKLIIDKIGIGKVLNTEENVVRVCTENPYMLDYLPDNLKIEKNYLSAFEKNMECLQYIPRGLLNETMYLHATLAGVCKLEEVPSNYKTETFYLNFLKEKPLQLNLIPHHIIQLSTSICELACKHDLNNFKHTPEEFRKNNPQLCVQACEYDISNFQLTFENFKKEHPEFYLQAFRKDNDLFFSIPNKFRTKIIWVEAISCGLIDLHEVDSNTKNIEFYLKLVESIPSFIQHAELKNLNNKEVYSTAVNKDASVFSFVPKGFRDSDMYILAIKETDLVSYNDICLLKNKGVALTEFYYQFLKKRPYFFKQIEKDYQEQIKKDYPKKIEEDYQIEKYWLIILNYNFQYFCTNAPAKYKKKHLTSELYKDAFWNNYLCFEGLPKNLLKEKEFCKEIIGRRSNYYSLLTEQMRSAPEIIDTYAKGSSYKCFEDLDQTFLTPRACALRIIERCGVYVEIYDEDVEEIPLHYKQSEFYKVLIEHSFAFFRFLPDSEKSNKRCLEAIKYCSSNYRYIPSNKWNLSQIAFTLDNEEERYHFFEYYLHEKYINVYSMSMLFRLNNDLFKFIPDAFKTEKLCKKAVVNSSENIKYVSAPFLTEELFNFAIRQNIKLLEELALSSFKKFEPFFTETLCKYILDIDILYLSILPKKYQTADLYAAYLLKGGKSASTYKISDTCFTNSTYELLVQLSLIKITQVPVIIIESSHFLMEEKKNHEQERNVREQILNDLDIKMEQDLKKYEQICDKALIWIKNPDDKVFKEHLWEVEQLWKDIEVIDVTEVEVIDLTIYSCKVVIDVRVESESIESILSDEPEFKRLDVRNEQINKESTDWRLTYTSYDGDEPEVISLDNDDGDKLKFIPLDNDDGDELEFIPLDNDDGDELEFIPLDNDDGDELEFIPLDKTL
ncbi:MAG: hypothetical protein ACI9U0_000587 [Flavobacteriales bacterium]|jgi:hypothetical protein